MTHLHPAVIHFPIAWFVTAIGFDVACLRWRHALWLDRVSVLLHGLTVLGAGAAVATGKLAQSSLGDLAEMERNMVEQHSEWAFFTLLACIAVFLMRIETAWRDRAHVAMRPHKMRLMSVVVALVALGLVCVTAARGASLVYDLGIAVGRGSVP